MKKLSLLLFFAFIFNHSTFAQSCKNEFYPFTKGVKSTYESFDKKGKLQTINTSEILDIKSVGDSIKATIKSVSTNEKGKELSSGTVVTTCVNGAVLIDLRSIINNDMTSAFKDGEVSMTGSPLELPSQLRVGQSLSNGDLTMIVKSGGVQIMKMAFEVSNRKVAKQEKLTVKAGTYDAYVITYDMTIDMMFKRTVSVEQWFVSGVGLVKMVTKDKNGNVESSMELSKLEK
jgi:hypothetical protein